MTTGHKSAQSFILALCLTAGSVFAQSSLPACQGSDVSKWTNCSVSGFVFNDYTYSGEFKDGKPSGQGTATYTNGSRYSGEYKNGKRNGQGTFTFANRSTYVGDFKDDIFNGQGTLTILNGDKYVGGYKDGHRNGQGILYKFDGTIIASGKWPNPSRFIPFGSVADFVSLDINSYPFNQPTQTPASNPPSIAERDRLTAEVGAERKKRQELEQQLASSKERESIESSLPACQGSDVSRWTNCFGTQTFASGGKYIGGFKDGKANGQGTFTFASGTKYVGEYKDGSYNGQGIYYWEDGTILRSGRWADDRLVQSFAIDTNRFPFNAPIQTASAPQAPAPDPVKAERDRLTAEVEAERRKRQELQAELDRAKELAESRLAEQQRPQAVQRTERRVALVIGNAAYKVNPLKNPVTDSNDMARSLRSVGFDVIEANNATLVAMREATRRFADKLVNSDVGLVYYSGHGVEVKGKNYLIPVNADIKREYEVVDQAFDASQFLEMMDSIRGPNNKRVNILLVDACRNNELQRSWRSTSSGLGRMDAPGGTFISFATAPGRVAADGLGRNSPYTKHLLQALKQPNMPIEQVFKVVRRNVMDETKGEQIPWDNSSLVGDFFFTVQR